MLTVEQLETRKSGIGGSDAAAACGVSPWKTPLQLWMEKAEGLQLDDLSNNDKVHFGNVLEDVVAAEFQRRKGINVMRHRATMRHKDRPFMLANIDRRLVGVREGLEIKTADSRTAAQWGEQGSDEIPMHYLLQCVHYMAVTGWDRWHVAVLIGGNEFRSYVIERDVTLEERLIDRENAFWSCVTRRVPPPAETAEDLLLLYPKDNGEAIVATPEIADAIESLKNLKAELKGLEAGIKDRETQIKAFLGDAAEIIVGGEGKKLATWKSHETNRLDSTALRKAHPAIADQFTTTSTQRPLRII